jgi:tight adherence protein C
MISSAPLIEIGVMVALAALVVTAVVADGTQRRQRRVVDRLTRYCLNPQEAEKRAPRFDIVQRIVDVVMVIAQPVVVALFGRERDRLVVKQLLWSAGFRSDHAMSMLAAIKAAAAIGGGVGVYGFLLYSNGEVDATDPVNLVFMAGGVVVGSIVPEYILRHTANTRREEMRASLPDAIDLMVIAAQAGLSLDMAMDRVRREMHSFAPSLAGEFAITMAELQALPDRTEAFQNLSDRIGVKEVQSFALALMQTVRYGTPFAKSLKALGTDLRQARMIALEERGAKLPALLSLPLIVFIMPSLFIVILGPAILSIMENFNR